MARTEARLLVEIWNPGSDFTAMTSDEQWMYFLLLSQPDLAHDGVLALRERRWARCAQGVTVDQIRDRLAGLEKANKIVVDEDTEEVLVRSFVRGDKVYRQPNVLRAAADHLPLVASAKIRSSLYEELLRVQHLEMPEGSRLIIAGMLEALADPSRKGFDNPSDNPSGKATAGTPGVRGVVTAVSTGFPVPRSPESPDPGKPTSSPSVAAVAADTRISGETRQRGTNKSEHRANKPTRRTDWPTLDADSSLLPTGAEGEAPPLSETQRSKVITDGYHALNPLCKWEAVNAVVLKAIRSKKYTDAQITAATRKLVDEKRALTATTLYVALEGVPPSSPARRTRSPVGAGASYVNPPDSDYTEDI